MREKAKYKIGDVFEDCDGQLMVCGVERRNGKYFYQLRELGDGGYEWYEDEMPNEVEYNILAD